MRANSRLLGLESRQARFGNIAGDVDLYSDAAGVTVALHIILARTLALGIECPFGTRFQGSDNFHARKQHGSAIFSGIDEHLHGKPPFLTITFRLRKLPDVVGGVSQGLRRRSLRERDRLSERTIPGHAELPSQTFKRPRSGRDAPERSIPLGSCSGGTGSTGIRRGVSMLVPMPQGCFAHREASSRDLRAVQGASCSCEIKVRAGSLIEGEDGAEGVGLVAD